MAGWLTKDNKDFALVKVPPDEPLGALGPNWLTFSGDPHIATRAETPPDGPLYPCVDSISHSVGIGGHCKVLSAYTSVPAGLAGVRFSVTIGNLLLSAGSFMWIADSAGTEIGRIHHYRSGPNIIFTWNGVSQSEVIVPMDNPDIRCGIEIFDGQVRGYWYTQSSSIHASAVNGTNQNSLVQIGTPTPHTIPTVSPLYIGSYVEGWYAKDFWVETISGPGGGGGGVTFPAPLPQGYGLYKTKAYLHGMLTNARLSP